MCFVVSFCSFDQSIDRIAAETMNEAIKHSVWSYGGHTEENEPCHPKQRKLDLKSAWSEHFIGERVWRFCIEILPLTDFEGKHHRQACHAFRSVTPTSKPETGSLKQQNHWAVK